LTIILCASFIRVTDCSIGVSRSFTRNPSAPQGYYTYMITIIKMIEIYNIAAQPYYCWWTHVIYYIETIVPRAPLTYLSSKRRRHFVTSYVQPIIQQYESKTVEKELFQSKKPLQTISVTKGNHHVQSTLFVVNKDEWDTKEGLGKSMKNALYVQWYGKRHLSGWSDVEQRKKLVSLVS